MSDDLAKAVAVLEARAAVSELVHRYAFNIRRGILDGFEALFTEDGEFHIRGADPTGETPPIDRGAHIGRAAIVAYMGTPGRAPFKVIPMIRNLMIEVDGNTATSTCLMSSRTWPQGGEVIGEYEDSYRLEDRWRFTKRVFT